MEMYALILWKETKETSVVPEKNLKEGDEVLAKYGRKYYPAKVIIKSTLKKWLDSLVVTTAGEILPASEEVAQSRELYQKKGEYKQDEKLRQKTKNAAKNSSKVLLAKSPTIFEEDSSNDDQSGREVPPVDAPLGGDDRDPELLAGIISKKINTQVDTIGEVNTEGGNARATTSSSSQDGTTSSAQVVTIQETVRSDSRVTTPSIQDSETNAHDEAINEPSGNLNVQGERVCICDRFPDITHEDIERFELILGIARALVAKKSNYDGNTSKDHGKIKPGLSKSKMVPLLEGSTILVPELKLRGIVDANKKKPRQMIRKLTLLILTKEVLLKSSPTGKNGWKPFPENVLEEVEIFVRENTKKKYRISHADYMSVLTYQCTTLRNPRKAPDAPKKVNSGNDGKCRSAQASKTDKKCVKKPNEESINDSTEDTVKNRSKSNRKSSDEQPPRHVKKNANQKSDKKSADVEGDPSKKPSDQSGKKDCQKSSNGKAANDGTAKDGAAKDGVPTVKFKKSGGKSEKSTSSSGPCEKSQKIKKDQAKKDSIEVQEDEVEEKSDNKHRSLKFSKRGSDSTTETDESSESSESEGEEAGDTDESQEDDSDDSLEIKTATVTSRKRKDPQDASPLPKKRGK